MGMGGIACGCKTIDGTGAAEVGAGEGTGEGTDCKPGDEDAAAWGAGAGPNCGGGAF
jgi:hypothetical protein